MENLATVYYRILEAVQVGSNRSNNPPQNNIGNSVYGSRGSMGTLEKDKT